MLRRIAPGSLLLALKTTVFLLGFALLTWLLGGATAPTRQILPAPTSVPAIVEVVPTETPIAIVVAPTETPRPSKSLGTRHAPVEDAVLLLPEGQPAHAPADTPIPTTGTIEHPPTMPPGPLATAFSKAVSEGASQVVPTATAPPPDTPTAVPPTATPQPDGTPILPTGAKYGDHNPNVPGRIVRVAAPSIKLDTGVYEVYGVKGTWEVADYAAGHHYNSLNPGEGGNIVLSGHNNWRGEVFRDLDKLKPGDEIHVWTQEGKEYVYKVSKIDKLKEAGASYAQRLKNAQVMNETPQEQLTLISCWPYTTFTHRLVVTADPVAK